MKSKSRIREAVKRLNPIDDLMFKKMSEDSEFCQEILRVILGDSRLTVIESISQWMGTNLQGRSVVIDAKCITGDGRQIIVEVQKRDDDDHQRRVRYESSIVTTNITDPSTLFKNVPDVCAVFISKFDVFNGNHTIYHVDRVVREIGKVVYNGFEEIYVNAAVDDGSDVSELMKVFVEDGAYNERFPKTSEIKRRYKETEEGVNIMKTSFDIIMDEILDELRGEVRDEIRGEVRDEIRGEVRDEIRGEMRDEIRGEVQDEEKKHTQLNNIKSLMETLKFSSKEAMDALKIPPVERQYYIANL